MRPTVGLIPASIVAFDGVRIEPEVSVPTFAAHRFAEVPTPELDPPGFLRVQMVDLRFGTPRQPGFMAVAILDEQSRVVRSWFSFLRATPR